MNTAADVDLIVLFFCLPIVAYSWKVWLNTTTLAALVG